MPIMVGREPCDYRLLLKDATGRVLRDVAGKFSSDRGAYLWARYQAQFERHAAVGHLYRTGKLLIRFNTGGEI